MSYQVIYRKWRPETFDDLCGQSHIVSTLKNEIKNDRIAHAYLFSGSHGTGKTTAAKIFSRAVNCLNLLDGNPCNKCQACESILASNTTDVYEIDAASNNGVDNVREIRNEMVYASSKLKYKVYIIDEVHMLSAGAFNALLKTLEEPPDRVIFILATTEPNKIPSTVISRCQRFDFRRIKAKEMLLKLEQIAKAEGMEMSLQVLGIIVRIAFGSMRDALSLLERCRVYEGELTYENVIEIVGVIDRKFIFDVVDAVALGDTVLACRGVRKIVDSGMSILCAFEDLISCYRDIILCKDVDVNNLNVIFELPDENVESLRAKGEIYTYGELINFVNILGENMLNSKLMSQSSIALEVAVMKLVELTKYKNVVTENNNIKILWTKVLNYIKDESKQLFAFLVSARVCCIDGEVFVNLASSLAYERVNRPEGLRYIESIFEKFSDEKLKLRIECDTKE